MLDRDSSQRERAGESDRWGVVTGGTVLGTCKLLDTIDEWIDEEVAGVLGPDSGLEESDELEDVRSLGRSGEGTPSVDEAESCAGTSVERDMAPSK